MVMRGDDPHLFDGSEIPGDGFSHELVGPSDSIVQQRPAPMLGTGTTHQRWFLALGVILSTGVAALMLADRGPLLIVGLSQETTTIESTPSALSPTTNESEVETQLSLTIGSQAPPPLDEEDTQEAPGFEAESQPLLEPEPALDLPPDSDPQSELGPPMRAPIVRIRPISIRSEARNATAIANDVRANIRKASQRCWLSQHELFTDEALRFLIQVEVKWSGSRSFRIKLNEPTLKSCIRRKLSYKGDHANDDGPLLLTYRVVLTWTESSVKSR